MKGNTFKVGDFVESQVAFKGRVGIVAEVKVITSSVPLPVEFPHLQLPDYQRVCVHYPSGEMSEGAADFYKLAS